MKKKNLIIAAAAVGVLLSGCTVDHVGTDAFDTVGDDYIQGDVQNAKETESSGAQKLQNPHIEYSEDLVYRTKVTFDCIYFGTYPQSEVTSAAAEYEQLRSETNWDAHGEAVLGEVRYKRIKACDATNIVDREGYYQWDDSYHYYRYEPIKWRVLYTANNTAFIMADKILDNQTFDLGYDIDWIDSTLRSWLNGYGEEENDGHIDYSGYSFKSMAFNDEERQLIRETEVENERLFLDKEGVNNTKDSIYIPAGWEMTDTLCGFSGDARGEDACRTAYASDYAHAMGLWGSPVEHGAWWIRSYGREGFSLNYVEIVLGSGVIDSAEIWMDSDKYNYWGVRPVMNIDLSGNKVFEDAGTVAVTFEGKQ